MLCTKIYLCLTEVECARIITKSTKLAHPSYNIVQASLLFGNLPGLMKLYQYHMHAPNLLTSI